MDTLLRSHADLIVKEAIAAVQPDAAVQRALKGMTFPGRVLLVAAGKAAWQMAKAASDALGSRIEKGVVVTKYGHVMGPIANFDCFEAGHPVPDENSFKGTQAALDLVSNLSEKDTVLFLLSGGGSALFEKPLVEPAELQELVWPARVEAVILSDILGDPLDMIASGPACPDSSTAEDAQRIAKKYDLKLSDAARNLLSLETPKALSNVRSQINGSVRELCAAAARTAEALGYTPILLTDQLCCQAREAGSFLSSILRTHENDGRALAFIAGGETVVKLIGKGLGGRNQELALSAAAGIAGMRGAAVFSVGSDGTDGPTDAAGGYCDGDTCGELLRRGLVIDEVLQNNDAYHALNKVDGLIMTGPTGTNVNDVAVALLRR